MFASICSDKQLATLPHTYRVNPVNRVIARQTVHAIRIMCSHGNLILKWHACVKAQPHIPACLLLCVRLKEMLALWFTVQPLQWPMYTKSFYHAMRLRASSLLNNPGKIMLILLEILHKLLPYFISKNQFFQVIKFMLEVKFRWKCSSAQL